MKAFRLILAALALTVASACTADSITAPDTSTPSYNKTDGVIGSPT